MPSRDHVREQPSVKSLDSTVYHLSLRVTAACIFGMVVDAYDLLDSRASRDFVVHHYSVPARKSAHFNLNKGPGVSFEFEHQTTF